jgi:hypothetical protein
MGMGHGANRIETEIESTVLMSAPDHSEIATIEERMKTAAKRLHTFAPQVAQAVTIIDYDSDRRKSLLARYAVRHIKDGESAAAADTLARASDAYKAELDALGSIYEQANVTMREWDAEKCSWETARSLLARQRETIRTLPETEA